MKTISYTHLRNSFCPIRQYLSLTKKANTSCMSKSAVLGILVHHIYEKAFETGNFCFVTYAYVDTLLKRKKLRKYIKEPVHTLLNNINKHLHIGFINSVPEYADIEKVIRNDVTDFTVIDNIITLFSKPDITYVEDSVCTIIEIKTSVYGRYDKLQLLFYAWAKSLKDTSITDFDIKVFNTHKNTLKTIDTYTLKELQALVYLNISSTNKAYKLLDIHSIQEVAPVIKSLIDSKSALLAQLVCHIAIEQCDTCAHVISCPVFLQEIITAFSDKTANETSSNVLSFCPSMLRTDSARKLLAQGCST